MLGLNHCHEHNVAHRDLKPENILLNYEDGVVTAKLGDFGCSKLFENSMNTTTSKIGTPLYMAPELFLCQNYKYKFECDIWSVGVIFYNLCQFQVPFTGNSMAELINNLYLGKYNQIQNKQQQSIMDLMCRRTP